MSRTIPYKLSLWKDTATTYRVKPEEPLVMTLTLNQIIYIDGNKDADGNDLSGKTIIYKGRADESHQGYFKYEAKDESGNKTSGLVLGDNIRIEKEVFEEFEVAELASNLSDFEGRAYNINFNRNINGMNTLSFSIPKKYYSFLEKQFVINDIPDQIWNKNKIKLRYGDPNGNFKWYTFIVNERVERREDKKIIYDFSCEDMLINELSRNGYSLTFDEDNGMGTIDELAEKILEGTEWGYQNSLPEDFIEKRIEYVKDENDNVEFNEDGTPKTEEVEVATAISKYNEYLERVVYRYQYTPKGQTTPIDKYDGKDIWGYDSSEVITSQLVKNLIYNSKEFTDSSGWLSSKKPISSGSSTYADTISIVPKATWGKDSSDGDELVAVDYKLILTPIITEGGYKNCAWAYNDTMKSARTTFDPNKKYCLNIKYTRTSSDYPLITLTNSTTISDSTIILNVSDKTIKMGSGQYFVFSPTTITSSPYLFIGVKDGDVSISEISLFEVISKDNSTETKEKLKSLNGILSSPQIKVLEENAIMPDSYDIDAYTEQTIKLFCESVEESIEYISVPEDSTIEKITTTGNKKIRTLVEEKSNRYNLLQSLAELFEGWIRFNVDHYSNGKIKRDEYGNQIKSIQFREVVGSNNWNGFQYEVNLSSISRTSNSEELVTKLWVEYTESKSSESGIVDIRDSQYNELGETFLYDFNYFTTIGEISYQQLLNDMYGTSSSHLHFITSMKEINKRFKEKQDIVSGLETTISKLKTERLNTILRIQSAKEQATNLAEQLPKSESYYSGKYFSVGSSGQQYEEMPISSDQKTSILNSVKRWGQNVDELYIYLKTVNDQLGYKDINGLPNDIIFEDDEDGSQYESSNSGYISQINNSQNEVKSIKEEKKSLINKFESKYMRYITEGTWQDDSYTNADKYFLDAENVLATSAMPKVSYDIQTLALAALNGYEDINFNTGDKTFVIDKDFLGYDKNSSPFKQEVVISEINDVLDEQNSSTITVQNFRTQFEDLFSRISASIQTLQLNDKIYMRAENFTPDGEILVSILQNTLKNNSITLSQAVDQSVIIDDRGIEVTDIFNPSKRLRIISDGVYVSSDGGLNWTAGFTASGMNATFITSGQIDTNKLRIMNGSFPAFTWDKLGISAYQVYTDTRDETLIDDVGTGGFVRFDQHGLYVVPSNTKAELFGYDSNYDPWYISQEMMKDYIAGGAIKWSDRLDYIQKNSQVSLTWRGLMIKSLFGSVEISTESPAIRIFDNYGGEASEQNFCRIELGFDIEGKPGGIIQRKDWDKINKIGNDTLYGINIRNSEGSTVLKTVRDGSLWLRENLFIGGEAGNEEYAKIGIQANGRKIGYYSYLDADENDLYEDFDGAHILKIGEDFYINEGSENEPDYQKYYLAGEENDGDITYYLLSKNNDLSDANKKVTLDELKVLNPNGKYIFWSRTSRLFPSQGNLSRSFDSFTIDEDGNVAANSIEISGNSQIYGSINAISGFFLNQLGLGTAINNGTYDAGFSARPNSLYEFRKLKENNLGDITEELKIGDVFFLLIDNDYHQYVVTRIDRDSNNKILVYYYNDGSVEIISGNPQLKELEVDPSLVYIKDLVDEGRDSKYALWIHRLTLNEKGDAIEELELPKFYVTHDGFLYGADAEIKGNITVTGGSVEGILTVGDNITIDGVDQSISVREGIEGGRQFYVGKDARVLADSIILGRYAKVNEYMLFGDSFALMNPAMSGNNQNIVLLAGNYLNNDLENSLSNGTQLELDRIFNEANLKITASGEINASKLTIVGNDSSITGQLKIYSDKSDSIIVLSGEEGLFSSSKTGQVTSGWKIKKDGSAIFENVEVRGTIQTSVLKYNEVQVSSGDLLVRPASKVQKIFRGKENNNFYFGIVPTEKYLTISVGNKLMIQASYTDEEMTSNSFEFYIKYFEQNRYGIVKVVDEENSENNLAVFTYPLIKIFETDLDEDKLDSFNDLLNNIYQYSLLETVKDFSELIEGREIFINSSEDFSLGYFSRIENNTVYYTDENGAEASTNISNVFLRYNENYSDLTLIDLGGATDGGIALNATGNNKFGNKMTINIFENEQELDENGNPTGKIGKRDRVVLGRLEDIRDDSFSGIFDNSSSLKGFGLYTENAFIKGTITTGKAGLTTKSSSNTLIWAGGELLSVPEADSPEEDEEAAAASENNLGLPNFYVKENGFLFARYGYFSGKIRSTDAEISGTIGASGLKIKDQTKGLYVASDIQKEALLSIDNLEIQGETELVYEGDYGLENPCIINGSNPTNILLINGINMINPELIISYASSNGIKLYYCQRPSYTVNILGGNSGERIIFPEGEYYFSCKYLPRKNIHKTGGFQITDSENNILYEYNYDDGTGLENKEDMSGSPFEVDGYNFNDENLGINISTKIVLKKSSQINIYIRARIEDEDLLKNYASVFMWNFMLTKKETNFSPFISLNFFSPNIDDPLYSLPDGTYDYYNVVSGLKTNKIRKSTTEEIISLLSYPHNEQKRNNTILFTFNYSILSTIFTDNNSIINNPSYNAILCNYLPTKDVVSNDEVGICFSNVGLNFSVPSSYDYQSFITAIGLSNFVIYYPLRHQTIQQEQSFSLSLYAPNTILFADSGLISLTYSQENIENIIGKFIFLEDKQISLNIIEEVVSTVLNNNGIQIYSGGDLEVYKEKILSSDLPPYGIYPYLYSDDTFEGLISNREMITTIPNNNELDLDQGMVLEESSISFKQLHNINLNEDKKNRVNNLNNNGDIRGKISYNFDAEEGNISFDVDKKTSMKIFKDSVSIKNLKVEESVSFDQIIIGNAIFRTAIGQDDYGRNQNIGFDVYILE